MIMRRVLTAAALAVPLTLTAVSAQAAPSPNNHLLDIVKVTSTSVTAKTSCNPDPNPGTGMEFITVSFPDLGTFGGTAQLQCNSRKQTVIIPLTAGPAVGTRVFTYVSISGDSGEINAWGTFRVQR
jgi:hypothetical protein